MMFETFNVAGTHNECKSIVPMCCYDTTGIVIDYGEDSTCIIPIFEGQVEKHSIQTIDIGGRTITDYFQQKVNEKEGCLFTKPSERDVVKQMKESICYVSIDYQEELKKISKNMKNHINFLMKQFFLLKKNVLNLQKFYLLHH